MSVGFGEITGGRKKRAVEDCCCVDLCCDNRCVPLVVRDVGGVLTEVPNDACANPLPASLAIDLTATPSYGGSTCFNGSGLLAFKTALSGGQECWEGTITGTCVDCNGAAYSWSLFVRVCCGGGRQFNAALVGVDGTICPAQLLGVDVDATMCDPFLLSVCWPEFGGCFVGCLDENQMPIEPPSYVVCAEIYETP